MRELEKLKNQRAKAAQEPRFLSLTATARRLGLSPATLIHLRRRHRLFVPALRGLQGGEDVRIGGRRVCARLTRFHVEQVRAIEAVLAGALDLDTAALQWDLTRARMALPPEEAAE
jgi:hypothetical protein